MHAHHLSSAHVQLPQQSGCLLPTLHAATLAASSLAFLPDSAPAASAAVTAALDPLCLLGAAGLGVSLQLIHIYIAPMKRALQVGNGDGCWC